MILLDTTVLLYAVGDEHPLREPCRTLIDAIGDERIRATTTVEVLQEFTHVRARRRDRADAVALATAYATLLAPLTVIDADDLEAGLRVYGETPTLGAFDAVLAGAAIRRPHIAALASADRAFSAVRGLRHVDPAAPDFLSAVTDTHAR